MGIEACGLIINPKWPWLGVSADRVLEVNGNLRAIEVKCPFSKKENTIGSRCRGNIRITRVRFYCIHTEGSPYIENNFSK